VVLQDLAVGAEKDHGVLEEPFELSLWNRHDFSDRFPERLLRAALR
jgi:hypothetical protein